jgi:hypothetical protein
MKTVIAKHPIKIGDFLIPEKTIGEVIEEHEMRKYFPNIHFKNENEYVAVKFSEFGSQPYIIPVSQLTFI